MVAIVFKFWGLSIGAGKDVGKGRRRRRERGRERFRMEDRWEGWICDSGTSDRGHSVIHITNKGNL